MILEMRGGGLLQCACAFGLELQIQLVEPPPKPFHTCCTSAPVASHRAEMALMEEILWARKALAVSLASSADQRFAVRMRSVGIQCA